MRSHKGISEPLRIIWNRRWLILTTMMAVMAATFWWANGLPRFYEASVVLEYTKGDAASVRTQLPRSAYERLLNKTALEALIHTDVFKEQRTAGVSVDRLAENIRQSTNITEEPRASGFAIRLSYRDRTPERAQLIARGLSQILEKSYYTDGQSEGAFRVENATTFATQPIMPRRLILTEVAIGIGILLGLTAAGIAELASRFRNNKIDPQTAR